MSKPHISKITAVLFVEAIEPSLPFWEKAGLQKTVEVPGDGGLDFALLAGDGVEVMYQSVRSLRADKDAPKNLFDADKTFLFVEVADIDAIDAGLAGFEIVMPRRKTFYGSTETAYREPGGHVITFAQMSR